MATSPISQIEERLQRLERERETTAARREGTENELPSADGWAALPPYEQRPTQELPGSAVAAVAAEIAQRSVRVSRNGVGTEEEGGRKGGARHVAELASDSKALKGRGF